MEIKSIASRIAHEPQFRPFILIIGLLGVCSVLLARSVDVSVVDKAGVNMAMPAQIGNWTGSQVWFCQKKGCEREQWTAAELGEGVTECPVCETELKSASWVEWGILDSDTKILKFQYRNPEAMARVYNAGIVLSGAKRSSIHRPEDCMAGGGNKITDQTIVLEIPREGKKDLKVKVLEMERTYKTREGKDAKYNSFYAYWFVGDGRETHSHYARMVYMATDRIFFDMAHRWAYISVSGARKAEGTEYQEELTDFIEELYGHLAIKE